MLNPLTPDGGLVVRRSELVCPGHSMKMMTKAAASAADEVIFDLEDACAVSQKEAARATVTQAFSTLEFSGKLRAFRPNAVTTPYFYRDVIEVLEKAGRFVDVVVLPKVNSADDVRFADRLISQIEAAMGLPLGRIRLEVLIESSPGLLNAQAIATASQRLDSLIFGLFDFAGDLGTRLVPRAAPVIHHAKTHLLACARAAGILAIDHVTAEIKDMDRLALDSAESADLGFDGKWAVHPAQLEIIHSAFTPSRDEISRALAMREAYARADQHAGVGAIVLNHQMVDAATLRVEQRKLELARRAGLLDAQGRLVP